MDTLTINSVDQTTINQNFVTVGVTIKIGNDSYSQSFVSNSIDPIAVLSDITSQGEVYKNKVIASSVSTPSLTLDNLVNEIIDL
jgi:hypothetical protein